MRVFIGIEFEPKVKDYLSDVQDVLRKETQKGNYTRHNNFHLTLRFLGELTQKEVSDYCEVLEKMRKKCDSFNISLDGLHSFLRQDKHLVYVDVLKNKKEVIHLSHVLDELIEKTFQQKREKKFKAHITIAREIIYADDISAIKIEPMAETISVHKISLMLSTRDQHHVLTYTPIYSIHLDERKDIIDKTRLSTNQRQY